MAIGMALGSRSTFTFYIQRFAVLRFIETVGIFAGQVLYVQSLVLSPYTVYPHCIYPIHSYLSISRNMTTVHNSSSFEKLADWLPLVLIVVGLVLDWLNINFAGLVLIAGFLTYGIFGIAVSVKRKYYKGFSIRFLKLANDCAITLLALGYFIGENTTWYILMLILLDRLILSRKAE